MTWVNNRVRPTRQTIVNMRPVAGAGCRRSKVPLEAWNVGR